MLLVLQPNAQPRMGCGPRISIADEEDEVEEDDVEMKGEASGEASRVHEDPFEEQMRLTNETSTEQLRASTAPK